MKRTKKIPDLNAAIGVNNGDLFMLSQNNTTRKTTFGAIKQTIAEEVARDREIEFRNNAGYIQWRHVGDPYWINLVSLEEIRGPAGEGTFEPITYFTGDGVTKKFFPISGIINNNAAKCTVTVGGVTQQAYASYTVSAVDGGTVTFDEAPPNNLPVSITPFQ